MSTIYGREGERGTDLILNHARIAGRLKQRHGGFSHQLSLAMEGEMH